jgi:hypothetical protein
VFLSDEESQTAIESLLYRTERQKGRALVDADCGWNSVWRALSSGSGIYVSTCDSQRTSRKVDASYSRGKLLQTMVCLRCRRAIEMGDKSVAVYMFAQTVGVRPRQKSSAQRVCFCPQCAVSLAMGLPPDGALNMVAWEMIRDLVSAEPSLNEAAWEGLRGIVGLLTSGKEESSGKYRRAG